MPLLVAKTARKCHFGINDKTDLPGLQEAPEGRFATATQTEITSQALFEVHKSKHLCCRTVWNNLSVPTGANTEAELEKEAWASPDDPSLEDLPLPPNT